MPSLGRPWIAARREKGFSEYCVQSHHNECHEIETCPCGCHTNPKPAAKISTPGETPPKRPEIKSGVKTAIPATAARQVKSYFAFGIWSADQALGGFRPDLWQTPEDRLTEGEIIGLRDAIYAELEARAPWVLKWLMTAGGSAPEAMLLYTLAMIALPRLARREVTILGTKITPEFARAVVFAPIIAQQLTRDAGATGVGAEPAHVDHRTDRNGQEHAGQPFVAGAPIPPGAAVQTGLGDVPDGSGNPNGARNGRYAP
jgi:hypothetical protein